MYKLSIRHHSSFGGYGYEVRQVLFHHLDNAKRYAQDVSLDELKFSSPQLSGEAFYARCREYEYYIWPLVFYDEA